MSIIEARYQASSRSTDIASLLESFLDENTDRLSPEIFRELDELAEGINDAVEAMEYEHNETKSELETRVEELENRVEQLEKELEELE